MYLPISQKNYVVKATVVNKEPCNVTKDDIVKEIVMKNKLGLSCAKLCAS